MKGLCLKQVFAAGSFRVSIPKQPVISVHGLSGSPCTLNFQVEIVDVGIHGNIPVC